MTNQTLPASRRKPKVHAPAPAISIKRAYDAPTRSDGRRVLVDRIWPRGISRERLAIDAWLKDVAPSSELRRWFNHEPARWREFVARYRAELAVPPASEALAALADDARRGTLTLVYAARDETHNNAAALREIVTQRLSNDRTPNS